MLPAGGLCIGQFFAAAVTFPMPKSYESHAVVGIMDVESTVTANQSPERPLRHITYEELNSIRTDDSLRRVIDALYLEGIWDKGKEVTVEHARAILTVERVPGTRLIRISANSTNRWDARDLIAQSIVVFSKRNRGMYIKASAEDFAEAEETMKKLEDDLVKLKEEQIELREKTLGAFPEDFIDSYDLAVSGEEFTAGLLANLKQRYASGILENRVREDSVFIKEHPEVSDTPVSPNITLNLQIGAIGGVLLFSILSFPLMFFLERRRLKKL